MRGRLRTGRFKGLALRGLDVAVVALIFTALT
jgi:hypothetical protein